MAVGVNIVSTFDNKGILKAIKDFKKIEGTGNKAAYSLKTFDKAVTNGIKNFSKAAAGVGILAGAIGYKLASAAYESQKVMAQTEAIIKATGGAAGVTSSEVAKLSEKLSMQIGVDDELIQTTANLLLTFKQVQNQVGTGNKIFDRAVIAAEDLGNVFGSADAAAVQLGKALSNPEKGITALNRAGINFTEQQKAQIKTLVDSGKILEAQKLILGEVESQVGGTAAAGATGFDRMRVALGNVAEKFGGLLIPYIETFANFVINSVVPYMDRLATVIGEQGLGAGIKFLAGGFIDLMSHLGKVGTIIFTVVGAVLMLKAAMVAFTIAETAAAIAVEVFGVAWNATGIGLIAAAIAAIVIGLILLYVKFEAVRKVVALLGDVIKFVVMNAIAGIYNYFVSFINMAITGINLLIKAANLFGAGLEEIPKLGYMAFQPLTTGAATAAKSIGQVQEALRGVRNEERAMEGKGTLPPIIGGGGGGAVESFADKVKKVVAALKGLSSEQKSVAEAGKAIKAALADQSAAHDKVSVALAKFNLVSKGYGENSKEAAKQSRAVADAQRELAKASTSVSDATNNLVKAEDALKKLREKPSALTMDNAEIALEQSKLDQEKAIFGVIDAEKELADLRTTGDATPEEIRKAEIALQEAKWAQRDVTLKITEAETALKKLREDTPTAEDIAAAERDVADAKLSVEEAIIAQQDATVKVNEENLLYSEIVSGAAEDTDIYKDALKELTDAKKDEADANQAVTDSYDRQREAVEKLIAAEIALQEVKKASGAAVVVAAKTSITKTTTAVNKRLPAFATGGIVSSPTVGLIGEAGPEAIIPLDQLGGMGGNTYITVNAGMGTDGAEVGKQIIDAIKKAERRSGKVFASA